MNKETILYGILGLLAGIIITGFAAGQAVNNNNAGMMRMMGMETVQQKEETREATDHTTMSMEDMTDELEPLTRDSFDKAFIEMMIAHHEGAVDMARLAESRAKHEEIKTLSRAIITAQESEIDEMKQWQKDWGYSTNEVDMMMHEGH